jgi:5,10-methylenetetrahydromethanopterin reductase
MTELWLHTFAVPRRVAEVAHRAEELGFAGLLLADSQNVTADIWVELALASRVTSKLRLGPGVTNPLTRHPAVTASAAATLQTETEGRVVLGFGQGDSALSQVGLAPLSVRGFEAALEKLQGLLRGEQVHFDDVACSLRWLPRDATKVPVHVAATGLRTVAAAARHAEGIDLTVGADVGRLRERVTTIGAQGPPNVTVGAYLNVAVDENLDDARSLVRGSVATLARFSARSESTTTRSHPAAERSVAEGARTEASAAKEEDVLVRGANAAAAHYDVERHGEAAAAQARVLDDQFIDAFAVVGPPREVTRRLEEIVDIGVERLIVVAGSLDSDQRRVWRSNERLTEEVLPALGRT